MPYYRWGGFYVYGNGDGTFHILVCDDGGGYIVCDRIGDEATAEWIAQTLNAALIIN